MIIFEKGFSMWTNAKIFISELFWNIILNVEPLGLLKRDIEMLRNHAFGINWLNVGISPTYSPSNRCDT